MIYALYNRISGEIVQLCSSSNIEELYHLVNDETNLVNSKEYIDTSKYYVNIRTLSFEEIPQAPSDCHIWDSKFHNWQSIEEIETEKENTWNAVKIERNKKHENQFSENSIKSCCEKMKILRNTLVQAKTLSDIKAINIIF